MFVVLLFKHNELCSNIWRCFSNNDDDDEYDEEQHDIVEQIQQLQQQLNQCQNDLDQQRESHSSSNENLRTLFGKLSDILVSFSNYTKKEN